MFRLLENCKIIDALTPQAGDGANPFSGSWISMKRYHHAFIVIQYHQTGDAVNVTWRVDKAPLVDGASAVPVTQLMNIWSNLDTATDDELVKIDPAVSYASGVGQTHKLIIFEVDPRALGDLAGVPYTAIRGTSVTNIAAAVDLSMSYILVPREQLAVEFMPSALID